MADRTEYHRQYYLNNREHIRARKRRAWLANRAAKLAQQHDYDLRHRYEKKLVRELGITMPEARRLAEQVTR